MIRRKPLLILILSISLFSSAGGSALAGPGGSLSWVPNSQIPRERLHLPPVDSLPPQKLPELSDCEGDRAMLARQVNQILADMKEIEEEDINYNQTSREPYGFVKGSIPILISAPHGAQHYRQDHWKGEDEYTSSLAIVLGQLTGAHVLYAKNRTPEDPNRDGSASCGYKELVREVVAEYGIKFVIDLHGSDMDRPYKVDVGIISTDPARTSCPTYRRIIEDAFAGFQEPIFNQFFAAKGHGTITSYCRNELGVESAQFEINAKYRVLDRKADSCKARARHDANFQANDKDVLELISRMAAMISQIHVRINSTPPSSQVFLK